MNSSTYSTATTGGSKITTEDLLFKLQEVMASILPEPIAEWMRSYGRSPDGGWILVLPAQLKNHFSKDAFLPKYVSFSYSLDEPVFLHTPSLKPRY